MRLSLLSTQVDRRTWTYDFLAPGPGRPLSGDAAVSELRTAALMHGLMQRRATARLAMARPAVRREVLSAEGIAEMHPSVELPRAIGLTRA